MAPPASWKGSLKLSLVTRPIALYRASTHAEKTIELPETKEEESNVIDLMDALKQPRPQEVGEGEKVKKRLKSRGRQRKAA
jgi:non-homologous end joining protein Ku